MKMATELYQLPAFQEQNKKQFEQGLEMFKG
jgi:hypothetical protein